MTEEEKKAAKKAKKAAKKAERKAERKAARASAKEVASRTADKFIRNTVKIVRRKLDVDGDGKVEPWEVASCLLDGLRYVPDGPSDADIGRMKEYAFKILDGDDARKDGE